MAIKLRQPRVGVATFSFLLNEDSARNLQSIALQVLTEQDLSVVCAVAVRSTEDARNAASELNRADLDLVVVGFSDWVPEDAPIVLARSVKDPILLWGVTGESDSLPLAGLACAASNLMRLGIPFGYVAGSLDSVAALREIALWGRAAATVKMLQDLRIGMFGLGCPGLITTGTGEIDIRQLGPEFAPLDLMQLMVEYKNVSEEEIAKEMDRLGNLPFVLDGARREDIRKAVGLYLAMKNIVCQERLDVIGVRCWPDLRNYYGLSPCLPFSMLMDEGVMGICENDPMAGVTMSIAYWLSGSPVFLADINTILEEERLLKLWHCGAASITLRAGSTVQVRKTFYDSSGCTLEFPLRTGPVTLLKISRPVQGRFKMLLAFGECVETRQEVRGNVANIRLDGSIKGFIQALIGGGFEHHLVVSYGDIRDAVRKVCDLLQIDLVEAQS